MEKTKFVMGPIQTEWLMALKNKRGPGKKKYRKGKGFLVIKREGKVTRHCCLGVACDLFAKKLGIKKRTRGTVIS